MRMLSEELESRLAKARKFKTPSTVVTGIMFFLGFVLPAYTVIGGMPKPAENAFIIVEAAGQIMLTNPPHGSTMHYGFSFRLKQPLHLTRVRIDDITGKPADLLVDDKNPKLNNNQLWAGNSKKLAFTPQNFPYMFENSNSKRMLRITASTAEKGDIVLNQAMMFDRPIKIMTLKLLEGSYKPKRDKARRK